MARSDTASAEVVRLVEVCLDALERGGMADVDEVLRREPTHAAAVRQRLDLLVRSGLLGDEDGEAFPESLGDFRLLKLLGRGGMGAVYLARQQSLGRDVALKLLRPGHMYFPGARDRFRREVEAVARLDHPGIVAAHLMGEDHGIPYFAMEHVVGASLDQLIAVLRGRRPEHLSGRDLATALATCVEGVAVGGGGLFELSWVDACFSVALQIGEALSHAHERGVLHRDVKPSNVMLTPRGVARVLDFGLALSEDASPLTKSGSVMGSLPYMAPEQVRGESAAIGAHTDVYAVGVTLYELLSLRSPYWSETAERTRQRILEGRPVPVDRLNSAVPWDAETVCQTAMERDPSRRYPTMQALVDDLRLFLGRRQIRARRSGIVLRARRWAERNPARAVAVGLAGILLVGGPLTYGLLSQAARDDLKLAYEQESDQRRRAEQSLEDAIAAVDEILRQGSDEGFADRPGADPERRRLLERALQLYERLLEREQGNEQIAIRVIRAQTRVAWINRELGRLGATVAAARRAVALCDGLSTGPEHERFDLSSDARYTLMTALRDDGQIEEFLRVCELVREEPPFPDSRVAAAQTRRRSIAWRLLAVELKRQGKLGPALEACRASVALGEQLLEREPDNRSALSDLAMALQVEAYFSGFHAPDADYAPLFQRAVGLLEKTVEQGDGAPGMRSRLATVLSSWAHVEAEWGHFTAARDRADRAHRLLSDLTSAYPFRAPYFIALLSNAQRLAWVHRKLEDHELARTVLEESIRTGRQGLERFPGNDPVALPLAILESELGRLLGERGEPAARDYWASSQALWERMLSVPSPPLQHVIQVGVFYDNLARYERVHGQMTAAELAARTALKWHRQALAQTGEAVHSDRLGRTLLLLAHILVALDRPDEALASLGEYVAAGASDREKLKSSVFESALGERAEYRELLKKAGPGRPR